MVHQDLGITVEEMLNLEVMREGKTLAGHRGLGNRITKMNVMEVPDIMDWVTRGEFLLTTAYSIKDDIEILKKLIPQMKEKGLAGIGIKMKRYVENLSQEIINIADDLQFPIVEIPFHVSYTDVIMPVLTEIINEQTHTLLKIHEIHNELTYVMLRGGGIQEIAQGIRQSIGNSIVIQDAIFDVAVICCDEEIRDVLQNIIAKEEHTFYRNMDRTVREKIIIRKEDNLSGNVVARIQIPIYVEERYLGYLCVWEDHKKLSVMEQTAIEAAIPMIALDLMKKTSIFEIESRHRIEFFHDLLSKDEKRQRSALERSSLFNFDNKLGYAVIVIKIHHSKGFIKETINNTSFLYQINGKILQIMERLARHKKEKMVFGNKSDQLILLYGTDKSQSAIAIKKELMAFAQNMMHCIESEIRPGICTIGIGRFYEDVMNLWKSYGEADKAAQNKGGYRKNGIAHFDDLGIYRVLCLDEMEEELIQFYQEILEPLIRYDRERESELIKTLQTYFKCGGNLKRISEEMYTHYNTIIYRIQRIKEITQMDLEDPNDRLNLQVALKIFEAMDKSMV
ncbi:MAG: transcriptional regulator, PucR family [Anaerosolibacter sp.]|uniref:PucR family transcriptional regulator n=1 Tax=Anaerosolibacter sp. TaxID=1872527 RepID=UPI0026307E46|nr:PucR family transcriptional regulator ligand-binding domain-containing protein [Anaerosolibacter sp.]MDF2547298.1 transcriptional regulator, PucR family [Anaerosolibacter sp.]